MKIKSKAAILRLPPKILQPKPLTTTSGKCTEGPCTCHAFQQEHPSVVTEISMASKLEINVCQRAAFDTCVPTDGGAEQAWTSRRGHPGTQWSFSRKGRGEREQVHSG